MTPWAVRVIGGFWYVIGIGLMLVGLVIAHEYGYDSDYRQAVNMILGLRALIWVGLGLGALLLGATCSIVATIKEQRPSLPA